MVQMSKPIVTAVPKRIRALDRSLDAALFRALGDATRLHLVTCLAMCCRPCSVKEVAECCDVDYSVGLDRSSFASEFRVVVTSPRLEALARTAAAEAIRLDEREAPQRELDRKQKEADDTRAAQEKARLANKATFTP